MCEFFAIADLIDTDRTDLLIEAIREYIEETADSKTFQELIATKCYDGQLESETVNQLAGAETTQRLRLPKADHEDKLLELAPLPFHERGDTSDVRPPLGLDDGDPNRRRSLVIVGNE